MSEKKRSRGLPLSPLRVVTAITETGPKEYASEEISTENLGWKTYGIASLPPDWVPPFFVITASCFEGGCSLETIEAWTTDCFARTGLDADSLVMVRSSGTSETIQYRGRLKSSSCLPHEVVATIRRLITQLPQMHSGRVHWIVQEFVYSKITGHLSNKRHLEKRSEIGL